MSKKTNNQTAKVNWPITILLIIGCLTVFFPLYMAVIIAFKQPSEMTNDIAGALAFPKTWSFANFAEAMKVTDFWHSLGNSLLLTIVTVILAILIHSLAGYAIGRSMANKKFYNFAYLYIVSGMFVPFAILMMPLVKQTAQIGIANRFGVIVLYVVFFMPMNILLYSGYLKNIPLALEEAARGRSYHLEHLLEHYFPDHETDACDRCGTDCDEYLERCHDSAGYHVWNRKEHSAAGSVKFPDPVRNQLQPGICLLSAGVAADPDLLSDLSETDYQRRGKRRSKII